MELPSVWFLDKSGFCTSGFWKFTNTLYFCFSSRQPYLILFYSDWCFTCLRIEPIWTRIVEELEPVGFGIATVHTEHEKEVTLIGPCQKN